MIHRPGIEVVSVVSLASSNGLWSFLRETVHSVAVVANGLRVCGVEKRQSGRVGRFAEFRGLESSVSRFRSKGKSAWSEDGPASVMFRLNAYRATPRVFSLSRSLRRYLHVDYESKYSDKLQKRAQE